jgi:hypothetical protein
LRVLYITNRRYGPNSASAGVNSPVSADGAQVVPTSMHSTQQQHHNQLQAHHAHDHAQAPQHRRPRSSESPQQTAARSIMAASGVSISPTVPTRTMLVPPAVAAAAAAVAAAEINSASSSKSNSPQLRVRDRPASGMETGTAAAASVTDASGVIATPGDGSGNADGALGLMSNSPHFAARQLHASLEENLNSGHSNSPVTRPSSASGFHAGHSANAGMLSPGVSSLRSPEERGGGGSSGNICADTGGWSSTSGGGSVLPCAWLAKPFKYRRFLQAIVELLQQPVTESPTVHTRSIDAACPVLARGGNTSSKYSTKPLPGAGGTGASAAAGSRGVTGVTASGTLSRWSPSGDSRNIRESEMAVRTSVRTAPSKALRKGTSNAAATATGAGAGLNGQADGATVAAAASHSSAGGGSGNQYQIESIAQRAPVRILLAEDNLVRSSI